MLAESIEMLEPNPPDVSKMTVLITVYADNEGGIHVAIPTTFDPGIAEIIYQIVRVEFDKAYTNWRGQMEIQ